MRTKTKISNSIICSMIMLFIIALSISKTTYAEYIHDEDSDSGGDIYEPNVSDPNANASGTIDYDYFDMVGEVEAYSYSRVYASVVGNWFVHAHCGSHTWAWSDTWWTWDEPSTPPGGYAEYHYSIEGRIHLIGQSGKSSGYSYIEGDTTCLGGVELDRDFFQYFKRVELGASAYAWAGYLGHWTWTHGMRFSEDYSETSNGGFYGYSIYSVYINDWDDVSTTNYVFGLELDADSNTSTYGELSTNSQAYFSSYVDSYCHVTGDMYFESN